MVINLVIFFLTGCFSLLLLTFIVYKTGAVHKSRDSKGQLKKKQSLSSIVMMTIVLILIISFFVLFGLFTFTQETGLPQKILLISGLMLLLVFFDSFFIDIFLIGILRPSFLHIPDETTLQTIKIHVIKTCTIGWLFIVPIILISAVIEHFLF